MDIKKHKFIILGSYTPNVLGQIRSLGEKGISPIGILIHKDTFRIDKSKYLSKCYSVDTPEEGLEIIIHEYGHEPYKPFLYTDRDDVVGIVDKHLDDLSKRFYVWNGGEQGKLSRFLNKNDQIELARQCGFRTPNTELLKSGELPTSLNFPVFTKATNSLKQWWKGSAYICNNESELIKVYNAIEDEELLVQEYIIKKDETPIEGISIDKGREIYLYGQTRNYRQPEDSFGTYRHIEKFNNLETEKKIKDFIRKIGYTGPFEIEFIIDKNGIAYFLEVNFRIAQQNYGYTCFGVNISYIYARSILENTIAKDEINYTSKQPFNIMYEFDDFKAFVVNKKIPLLKWLKDVKSTDVFLLFNKNDIAPFLFTLWEKFKKRIF